MMKDKNAAIEALQKELQSVQIEAVEKIREFSFKERDLLIAEKVKNANLQAELDNLKGKPGSSANKEMDNILAPNLMPKVPVPNY